MYFNIFLKICKFILFFELPVYFEDTIFLMVGNLVHIFRGWEFGSYFSAFSILLFLTLKKRL